MKTLEFYDKENKDKCVIILRRVRNEIGICMSLEKNGDMEVFMDVDKARKIKIFLEEMIYLINNNPEL